MRRSSASTMASDFGPGSGVTSFGPYFCRISLDTVMVLSFSWVSGAGKHRCSDVAAGERGWACGAWKGDPDLEETGAPRAARLVAAEETRSRSGGQNAKDAPGYANGGRVGGPGESARRDGAHKHV